MACADKTQLTGPVIEKLLWSAVFDLWPVTPEDRDQWGHVREHIQQEMLDGNDDAWAVFRGIAETAVLAVAIAQQNRTNHNKT